MRLQGICWISLLQIVVGFENTGTRFENYVVSVEGWESRQSSKSMPAETELECSIYAASQGGTFNAFLFRDGNCELGQLYQYQEDSGTGDVLTVKIMTAKTIEGMEILDCPLETPYAFDIGRQCCEINAELTVDGASLTRGLLSQQSTDCRGSVSPCSPGRLCRTSWSINPYQAGPVDILGGNDQAFETSSASDCMKGCDADQLCQAWVWITPSGGNPRRCHFKPAGYIGQDCKEEIQGSVVHETHLHSDKLIYVSKVFFFARNRYFEKENCPSISEYGFDERDVWKRDIRDICENECMNILQSKPIRKDDKESISQLYGSLEDIVYRSSDEDLGSPCTVALVHLEHRLVSRIIKTLPGFKHRV
ncbi:uncharacterized protein LOC111705929 isoform X1 [Eurytemora carolleeae]|uniref:uncharacterized protein LOC111705929 isoform X1 n=1 Tax=Eurytemora carolleeae TaxID=1294199 RepID=UPI000C7789E4|nr:uncharacterized protein LOC111705929 isoform X1 [Eurytemora carolleeae]|eukprot:XP_023334411.1 uncharacterized protein LOC111705929 isoform X1 [Eurytemora affinis]